MNLLHTVVSSYEVSDIVHLMRQQDPHVIINMVKTENFFGGFYRAGLSNEMGMAFAKDLRRRSVWRLSYEDSGRKII